jgi:hypothetical protein
MEKPCNISSGKRLHPPVKIVYEPMHLLTKEKLVNRVVHRKELSLGSRGQNQKSGEKKTNQEPDDAERKKVRLRRGYSTE